MVLVGERPARHPPEVQHQSGKQAQCNSRHVQRDLAVFQRCTMRWLSEAAGGLGKLRLERAQQTPPVGSRYSCRSCEVSTVSTRCGMAHSGAGGVVLECRDAALHLFQFFRRNPRDLGENLGVFQLHGLFFEIRIQSATIVAADGRKPLGQLITLPEKLLEFVIDFCIAGSRWWRDSHDGADKQRCSVSIMASSDRAVAGVAFAGGN